MNPPSVGRRMREGRPYTQKKREMHHEENNVVRRMYELFNYNKTTLGLYNTMAHLYSRGMSYIYPAKQLPNGKKSALVKRQRLGFRRAHPDSARGACHEPTSCGICHDLPTDVRGAEGCPTSVWEFSSSRETKSLRSPLTATRTKWKTSRQVCHRLTVSTM
jgi:hypothetical protein